MTKTVRLWVLSAIAILLTVIILFQFVHPSEVHEHEHTKNHEIYKESIL
ncbi:hypothetical protein [Halalkalibacter wakoensis]|nr:hypothetical protein [Halalkalibacter wakoensis]